MPSVLAAAQRKVKSLDEKMNKMKLKNDIVREAVAEFLGTFILVLLGDALTAALVFGRANEVGSVAGPIGWGLALVVAISVVGGVSGCHANPAVSVAFASVGKLKMKKLIPYLLAQYAGGFVAAILVYAIYFDSFGHYDDGVREIPPNASATAQIFATYLTEHVSIMAAIGDTVVSTMILMMSIVAITDPNNMQIPKGSCPLLIGLALSATIFAFPYNCGAPLNPARDLSPRLFTAMAGWGGPVFSFRNYGYFWVPILGPHIGAILGAWVYKLSIELHWPVDSYDFGNPTEVKTNGEFSKKEESSFQKRALNPNKKTEE